MFHHHRSLFPLLLALLTILLIILMIWKLQPKDVEVLKSSNNPPAEEPLIESVTPAEYEQRLADLLSEFIQKYDVADQDFIRVIAVDQTLSSLLDLKVPTQYKDLHLSIAVNLNLIRRGLTDNPARLAEGLNNLQNLRQEYSWLP